MMRQVVDPEWINEQRNRGWPDMHPEDFCHRCGVRNPSWYASRGTWLAATKSWAAETGREGICCPTCLLEMFIEEVGEPAILEVKLRLVRSPFTGA